MAIIGTGPMVTTHAELMATACAESKVVVHSDPMVMACFELVQNECVR